MATGLLRRIVLRRNGQICWQLGQFATHYLHGDVPPVVMAKRELQELPSDKKQMLHEAVHGLENNINFAFTQLKVIYSNVNKSELFTRTFLDIEKSYKQPGLREVDSFASVFEKGINVLKRYLEDPENVPEDHEKKVALVRLMHTILSCEDIEIRLSKMVKLSETDWCICVVHHFLKELSVSRQYRIDKDSRYKGIFCPCCDDVIGDECFSDCSLGHPEVWHGRVDVLLGPYPVAVVAKSSDDYFEDDIDGSLSSFEVEEHRNYTQIVAQSIVFAFLQKKMNPYFENFLIPTVGISRKNVVFYLYDPEHDILLESSQFDLIVDNTSLYYPTILALWLTLNYKTFCTGITKSMKERNFTTDILSSVSNDIKTIYKEQLRFGNCAIGQKPEPFRASIAQGLTLTRCKPWKPRKAVRS